MPLRRRDDPGPPVPSAIVDTPEKHRDHRQIKVGIVGKGPKWYDGTDSPPPPPLHVGAKVDVLLNDGRIMRTTVKKEPYCGGIWLDGVVGSVRVTRVRAVWGWADQNHVSYDVPQSND